jgi:hypothetical protein
MAHWRVLGLVAAFLLCAQQVCAQSDEDRAGARAAASQGIKAFKAGRWAEAADLMARAEALLHAPTHLLYLGQAEEKQGHLVKARETYLKLTRETLPSNASPAFKKAQADGERLLEALEPRLPYVNVLVVPKDAAELNVTMDGAPVPAAIVGVEHPIDPGEHTFQATAKGWEGDPVTISIAESEHKNVEMALRQTETPPAEDVGGAGAAAADAGAKGGGAPPATPAASGGMSPWTIGGFVGLAVGAAGIGMGTYFVLDAASLRDKADGLCTLANGGCPEDKRDQVDSYDSDADASNRLAIVGYVVGGVGVVGGIAALMIGANDDSAPAEAGVRPYFGPATLGLTGRF